MPASFLLQSDINALYNKEHDHSCHNGASTVADKRKRHSGQGDQLDPSPYSEKYLENIHDPNAVDDQLIETVPDLRRDMHHHHKAADHDQDQADAENDSQLLAYG